jgi:hypothetical protein
MSHENFLKQNKKCLVGLKYFENLAMKDFNVSFLFQKES